MEQLKLPKGDLLHRYASPTLSRPHVLDSCSNCFKCTTCGGFLKVGFYVIEDGKYHCKVRPRVRPFSHRARIVLASLCALRGAYFARSSWRCIALTRASPTSTSMTSTDSPT